MGLATLELVSPRSKPESDMPLHDDLKPTSQQDGFQVFAGAVAPVVTSLSTRQQVMDSETGRDSPHDEQLSSGHSVAVEPLSLLEQPRNRQHFEIQPATPLTPSPWPENADPKPQLGAAPGVTSLSAAPEVLGDVGDSASAAEGEAGTAAVQIFGLQKLYRSAARWQFWRRGHQAHAVRGLWLGIEQGTLICAENKLSRRKDTLACIQLPHLWSLECKRHPEELLLTAREVVVGNVDCSEVMPARQTRHAHDNRLISARPNIHPWWSSSC